MSDLRLKLGDIPGNRPPPIRALHRAAYVSTISWQFAPSPYRPLRRHLTQHSPAWRID
jgi:hypothetical protein